ncbi:MAG: SBBP repeat-containing protein [bacterium]|nr:SBBP repeat-containing protein [bacterium]
MNQSRLPNPDVLFIYNQENFQVQLTKTGFSYQINKLIGKVNSNPKTNKHFQFPKTNPQFQSQRVDFIFKDANTNKKIIRSEPNSSYINYYNEISGDLAVFIRHYSKILYKDIYPGIDIEFVIGEKFKYNIIAHPGSKLQDFQLDVLGAPFEIGSDGNVLNIKTPLGLISEKIPYSYFLTNDLKEKSTLVKFNLLLNGSIGLVCPEKKDGEKLVVDPSPWATYFGGTYYENGNSIATDTLGNIYTTGYTYSASNIATNGAFQSVYGGFNDGFILKFLENGQLCWATYYGGENNDYCYDISISKQGHVIVAGLTGSVAGIASSNAFQDTLWGVTDAFVVKLSQAGTRIWSSYFGGDLFDYGYGITSDENNNIILSGYSSSLYGVSSTGAYQTSNGGGNDGFLAKFNASGGLIWSTFYGGLGNEYANGITSDLLGNIYLAGFTSSANAIASLNVYQPALSGSGTSDDAFLVKFSPNGTRIWGTYFGGEGNEDGRSVMVDKAGFVYLTGSIQSALNIASMGALQSVYKGEGDGFLAKFDSSGLRIWSTYFGDNGNDYSNKVIQDKVGDLVLCGFTSSETGMSTINTHQLTNKGGFDALITKFDTSGFIIWSTYYGGLSGDFGYNVAIGLQNYIYFTGLTTSTSFITTTGSWQPSIGGTNDAFIVSMTPNGNLIPISNNHIIGDQTLCKGNNPSLVSGSTPIGGSGSFTYSWLISTVGPNSNFTLALNSANQPFFQPQYYPANTIWIKRLVKSGGDADSSNSVRIDFNAISQKNFTLNGSNQCVKGNNYIFTFNANPLDSITYLKWHLGESNFDTSNQNAIQKQYNLPGYYQVKLLLANNKGCKDSSINYINVLPSPSAIVFTNSPTSFCAGAQALIQTNLIMGTRVNWLINGVPTLDTLNQFNCNKTGLVQAIHTNNYGCIDTSTGLQIIAYPNPIAKILNQHGSNACSGDFIQLTSEANQESFYQWRLNNQNIFGSNQNNFAANKSGNYQVILRNAFGCYDTSNFETLSFNERPSANLIYGLILVKNELKSQTYHCALNYNRTYNWWVTNGNLIKTDSNFATMQFPNIGTASIKMLEKNSFGCFGDTNYLFVTVEKFVGLKEVLRENIAYDLFPNPSNGYITLSFKKQTPEHIVVLNENGQLAYESKANENLQILNLIDLSPGLYFILPSSSEYQFYPRKFIIEP